MAINDSHFKAAIDPPKAKGEGLDLPIELIGVVGGLLVVFVIVMLIIWKRINAPEKQVEYATEDLIEDFD